MISFQVRGTRIDASVLGAVGLMLFAPQAMVAQTPPIIDTIILEQHDVFTAEQSAGSGFYRTMNKLHIQTRPFTIRRELLFSVGDEYDPALAEESERNLRQLEVFNDVAIDTTTVDGKFAVVIRTQDGWSTKPKLGFQVASDGTLTYNIGATEVNLLGTANLVHIAYRKDVDRTAFDMATKLQRILGSSIDLDAQYENFSDGKTFNYLTGDPFRRIGDPAEFVVEGERTDRRMLQYFATNTSLDTTTVRRDAAVALASGGWALGTSSDHYIRLRGHVQLRQERFTDLGTDLSGVDDSVSGAFAVSLEWRKARFITMRRFNGFGSEDIDASTFVYLGVAHTSSRFGYEQNGWGPIVQLAGTVRIPNGFITAAAEGHGIFDASGLDSGSVELRLTAGFKPGERHASVIHVQGGRLEGQTPGSEYDLGFDRPPRSWEPHSFVGNRMVWATAEHKFFITDAFLGLFGIAIAGFADYGGAWYDGQQARYGGNVGIGLRSGSALATVARTGRIDVGYRFGDGVTQGSRWVLSVGAGWVFGGGKDPSCVPMPHQVRYRCRGRS